MICKFFCVVLLAAVVAFVADLLTAANAFKKYKSGPDGCTRLLADDVVGCEDGDEFGDIAIFTSDDRQAWLKLGSIHGDRAGGLANTNNGNFVRYSKGKMEIIPRVGDEGTIFHPHGISVLDLGNGKAQLFVVNHRPNVEEVLIYEFDGKTATLIDSIRDDERKLFRSLNDVVAINEKTVYVTIWEYFKPNGEMTTGFLSLVEQFGRMPWTYVLRCTRNDDGWQCDKAAEQLVSANGVNVSRDRRRLYVAECISRTFKVYDINQNDGSLTLKHSIDALGGIDNIHVNAEERVFITVHPQLLKFLKHVKNTDEPSPTIVAELKGDLNGPSSELSWDTLYEGDGLSAGAIGFPKDDQLLIGAVFVPGIHSCPLQKQ